MIVTAVLASGVSRVVSGGKSAVALIDEIMQLDHSHWESILNVGDVAFYQSDSDGPFPNHQFRVSVSPQAGYGACHYTDHDDLDMPWAISWNSRRPWPRVNLVFNGTTGAVFPRAAAIPIADVRNALVEWVHSRARPTCIEWRPYQAAY